MDSDLWARLSTPPSRRHQSRSDTFQLGDEIDADDESMPEYLCPFCADDFDIVGLCCHIDEEHTIEANNGVCPVCAKRVGMDLIGHITMQHGNLLKMCSARRDPARVGPTSALSFLKKELREGNLQSLLGGSSSYAVPSSNTEPDPWLSSFMCNSPVVNEPTSPQHHPLADASSVVNNSKDSLERNVHQQFPLSDKDQEEKARRSEFVQGLLMSTFLDDDLL